MQDQKIRHGCLAKWLILMLVADVAIIFLYILNIVGQSEFHQTYPWLFPISFIITTINIVFVVALWKWKKWGFWGLVGTSLVFFIINLLTGLNVFQAGMGFVGLAILYVLLQIGKDYKGWAQLE